MAGTTLYHRQQPRMKEKVRRSRGPHDPRSKQKIGRAIAYRRRSW
jgi:hypothetical protein